MKSYTSNQWLFLSLPPQSSCHRRERRKKKKKDQKMQEQNLKLFGELDKSWKKKKKKKKQKKKKATHNCHHKQLYNHFSGIVRNYSGFSAHFKTRSMSLIQGCSTEDKLQPSHVIIVIPKPTEQTTFCGFSFPVGDHYLYRCSFLFQRSKEILFWFLSFSLRLSHTLYEKLVNSWCS